MNQLSNLEQLVLATAREEMNSELPLLRQILAGTDVMDIVLASFEEMLLSDYLSLQKLNYLRELSRQLRQLPSDSFSENVEELLLYMNFNHKQYTAYKLKQLSEMIHSLPTTHQQLSRTKWLLKINKQQQEHAGFQYCHHCSSLKEQISDWLKHESEYLEYQTLYPDETITKEEIARWQSFKVKMKLSVNELAFFLRVMMENGLIQNQNKTEVADFFARFFSTNNQEMLSAGSIRNKMYNYDSSSASSVQQLFFDLFHTSKKIINN